MKRLVIFILTLLVGLSIHGAETTWTGTVNFDWSNNGNWSNGVPSTIDTAYIISDSVTVKMNAELRHLKMSFGAKLIVAGNGGLRLINHSGIGIICEDSYIQNRGNMVITTIDSIGILLMSGSDFDNFNDAHLTVDHTLDYGIAILDSSTFLNSEDAQIDMDITEGIENRGYLESRGPISINSSQPSFQNHGELVNKDFLSIIHGNYTGSLMTNLASGLVTNESQGVIIIKRNLSLGLQKLILNFGSIHNIGRIVIEDESPTSLGIENLNLINNLGEIIGKGLNTGISGIGSINNLGQIHMDKCGLGFVIKSGIINNESSGTIYVLNSNVGFSIQPEGELVNDGPITIDSSTHRAIENYGFVHNMDSIWISDFDNLGIMTQDSFINDASSYLLLVDGGTTGISVDSGTFQNLGSIEMEEIIDSSIINRAVFINSGHIDIENSKIGISNFSLFTGQQGHDINITHVEQLAIANYNGGKFNSHFGKISIENSEEDGIRNEGLVVSTFDTIVIKRIEDIGIFSIDSIFIVGSNLTISNAFCGINNHNLGVYFTHLGKTEINDSQVVGLNNNGQLSINDSLIIKTGSGQCIYNSDTLVIDSSALVIAIKDKSVANHNILNNQGDIIVSGSLTVTHQEHLTNEGTIGVLSTTGSSIIVNPNGEILISQLMNSDGDLMQIDAGAILYVEGLLEIIIDAGG